MSQFRPQQQQGVNDLQLLQQHLMYKQLQELQRQQQFPQVDPGGRPQNLLLNSLPATARPVFLDQLPAVWNEMPTNDASNYVWSNNSLEGELKTISNSQSLVSGNLNRAQFGGPPAMNNFTNGIMLSNNQVQSARSAGLVPQQLDQSFYSMPVSSTRSSPNQYSRTEKASMQSDPFNSFHTEQHFPEHGCLQDGISYSTHMKGKGLFGDDSIQTQISGVALGNPQQVNHVPHGVRFQEFHNMKNQGEWSGSLQEKLIPQTGPTNGAASLDPTEEKILFGTDDDDNWGASFGRGANSSMGAYAHSNPVDNDYFGGFSSLQSGSWSALVQEAVQATSSDNGLQEEWSGLSFQRREQSIVNNSTVSADNEKMPATWEDNNLQSASALPSRPVPVFNSNDGSMNYPRFHHPSTSAYEQKERVSTESLSAPAANQQSSGEANNKKLYTSLKQRQSDEGSLEAHMNISNGCWARQTYELQESNSHSSNKPYNSQRTQGFWASPQNMLFHNVTNESSNKSNAWSTNNSLPPGGDGTLNTHGSDASMWNVTGKDANSISRMEQLKPDFSQMQHEEYVMDKYAAMVNSNMVEVGQETNQQVISRHHVDYGNHGVIDSSIHSKADENLRNQNQPSRCSQSWDSPGNSTDRRSGDCKQEHLNVVSNDSQTLNYLDQGKHTSSGYVAKGNSLSQYDPRTMGSRMLHNQQMGSLGTSGFPFSQNTMSNSQGVRRSIVEQSNNLEQRFLRYPQNVSNVSLDRTMDARESVATGDEELKSRGDIPSNDSTRSSFDGSAPLYSNNRTVRTSQNMLELLHNSDKSRNSKSVSASQVPESTIDVSATHQQQHQLSMTQGFGLRLAPPTQRQPVSSQSSFHSVDSKQFGRDVGDMDQTRLTSTSARQSLSSQATSRDDFDGRTSLSEQKGEAFSSHNQVSSSSAVMFDSSYRYQQQNSGPSGHTTHPKLQHDSYDGGLSDQSAVQEGAPGLAGRVPPSRHASSSDTYPSQLRSAEMEHTRPSNAGFPQMKNSGQQLPAADSRSGTQPSIPGMHQQVGLSTMFKNVWTNISAQQRLSGAQPNKITPNMLQSMILANNSRDSSLWGLRKVDDQGKKREDVPSEVGTSSTNSQNHEEKQVLSNSAKQTSLDNVDVGFRRGLASQSQESFRKYSFDGSSAVPVSSLARLHQQDVSRGKHGEDSATCSQTLNMPLQNAASSSDMFHGRTLKPSEVQQHSYSLLHQMQAMKGASIDPSNRSEKRLKGADFGSDASQVDWRAGQRFPYGQDNVFRVPLDNNAGATSHSSFSSDAQIISFVSKENEERNAVLSTQSTGRDMSPLSASPASNLVDGSDHHSKISPQMAPSWFEQYGTYRNCQNLAMYDGQKVSTRQYDFSRLPGHMDKNTVIERRLDSSQDGSLGQNTASTMILSNELPHWPSDIMETVIMRPKKRKTVASKPLPWHKVIEGPEKLQSIRLGEMDWAQASNRLIDKVEDEAEMPEDGLSIAQSRRRLIITTQLTQQLIPAVPAAILKAEAACSYESLTYNVAKLALGDACSLVSCLGSKSCLNADDENIASERTSTEKVGDHLFSKAVDDFIGRSKNLETDFTRLDKKTSMLDVRLECQEMERFSIVNRLGKFHGRNHTEGVEGSTSETAIRRTFPQRYVTALSMAGNLPEGVLCFSL